MRVKHHDNGDVEFVTKDGKCPDADLTYFKRDPHNPCLFRLSLPLCTYQEFRKANKDKCKCGSGVLWCNLFQRTTSPKECDGCEKRELPQ